MRLLLCGGLGFAFTSRLMNESMEEEGNALLLRTDVSISYAIHGRCTLIGGLGYELRNTSAVHEYRRDRPLTEEYGYVRQFLYPHVGIGIGLDHRAPAEP